MIERDELDAKAREFSIPITSVERDYVLGWLIYAIFTQTSLKDLLFLKGGNALRKCYFQDTRYSFDVDFGTPYEVDQEWLKTELIKACDYVSQQVGVTFRNDDVRIEEKFGATTEAAQNELKVFEVRLYFQDFYSHAEHIRIKIAMDLTRFDRTILPIQSRPLFHPYSDAEQLAGAVIQCAKAEEILATKLKCILQREHAPDLFDVVYPELFPASCQVDKKEVLFTFLRKTIFEPNPIVVKNILLKTPFDFFRNYWNKSIVCAKTVFFDAEMAIQKFTGLLSALFEGYVEMPWAESRFFGPEMRAPIMQAARTQTLLRMTYNGYERVIEPYSLKYMERRTGDAREYLFVWNRSGGSQAKPGMRMFVSENVQSVTNTDERFEPRYPIELSRAGEPVDQPLLYDPTKTVHSTSGRGHQRHSGPRYVFRCSVCRKLFYKSSYDASLGEHKGKGKSAWRCYGTYGQYVKTIY